MIVPDLNLMVYAYNTKAPHHSAAREWLETVLNGTQDVGFPWVVSTGFIRLMTHHSVVRNPLEPDHAVAIVRKWLSVPVAQVLNPGPRHLDILGTLLKSAGTAGNITTDAHIAAICIEHQARLFSNDTDMARFPGLVWTDPLQ